MPIAWPLSSNLYISPITPAPTAKPGDDPIICTNRHDINCNVVREDATPKDPKKRRGIAVRYTGVLPSKDNLLDVE